MKRLSFVLGLALAGTSVIAQGGSSQSQNQGQQQSGVTAKGATVQVTTEPANGQQPAQQPPAQQQSAQGQGQNTPTSQKVIKDQAEYNAYMTALNTQDPAQKAAAMEAFVQQYPNSVVKIDALEQAMGGYQQAGNQAKVEETARQILQSTPSNIRALAIVTFIDRGKATAGDAAAMKSSCDESQKGIEALPSWQKPEGSTDAEFQKLQQQMTNIFEGAAGFCALQSKNYAAAREHFAKSLKVDPNNLQDTYQLAVADLESNPMDLNGFWYAAKAIALAQAQNNPQAVKGIDTYARSRYKRYHGGEDGWNEFVASAATQTAPPPNITELIKPAPTPAELACKAVQENDPSQLSFGDWEFILQFRDSGAACNKDAADKVWAAIQAKQKSPSGEQAKLKIPVKVVSADKDSISAAMTDENQAANKADLQVTMAKPMTKIPETGATIDIIGVISDYTPNPFMFKMTEGELPAPKTPPKRPTPAHRPTKK